MLLVNINIYIILKIISHYLYYLVILFKFYNILTTIFKPKGILGNIQSEIC